MKLVGVIAAVKEKTKLCYICFFSLQCPYSLQTAGASLQFRIQEEQIDRFLKRLVTGTELRGSADSRCCLISIHAPYLNREANSGLIQ